MDGCLKNDKLFANIKNIYYICKYKAKMIMEEQTFNRGDYVYLEKIGLNGELLCYISIVNEYDNESQTLYEIASVMAKNMSDNDEFDYIWYDSMTNDVVYIRKAIPSEIQYLDLRLADDARVFNTKSLTINEY